VLQVLERNHFSKIEPYMIVASGWWSGRFW
jgi:hypothetical protein